MDIVCCEKGHFYDASQHASCPECAAMAAGQGGYTAPNPQMGYQGYPPTSPLDQGYQSDPGYPSTGSIDQVPPTEPVAAGPNNPGPTMPVNDPGFTPGDMVNGGSYGGAYSNGVEDYQHGTMPVSPGSAYGFNPVTGWLVSVEGPDRGTDYRIHANYNYIGRAESNDICIKSDAHISNERHAVIGYDPKSKVFMFAPAAGRNIVRVNDRPVFNSVELNPYDILEIGTTKFIFVPLCTEKFSWDR